MTTSVRLFDFHGVRPLRDARLLNAAEAMVVRDVNLIHGDLQPWRVGRLIKSFGFTPTTVIDTETSNCNYHGLTDSRFDHVEWTMGQPVCQDIGMVYYVSSPERAVIQVERDRICQPDHDILGVPCPDTAPTSGGSSGEEGCQETCQFRYTFVNEYGQEGPPSPSTPAQMCTPGGQVVDIPSTLTGGAGLVRVYRTASTQDPDHNIDPQAAGEWLLVGEAVVSPGDSIQTTSLSESLSSLVSTRWAPPPDRNVSGIAICTTTNSMFISVGNVIHISEPGQYHAYPRDRDLVLDDNVVSLRAYSGGIAVLTDGHPYYISASVGGDSGPKYQAERNESPIPCVSKKSVAVGTSGVIWASNDGLFVMGSTRFGLKTQSLTSEIISRTTWEEIRPDLISGTIHDGAYYFSSFGTIYNEITTTEDHSYILTFNDSVYEFPTNVILTSLSNQSPLWVETRRDRLLYVQDENLYEWDKGDEVMPYDYFSRVLVSNGRTNFAAAKILHDADGDLTFQLYRRNQVNKALTLIFSRVISHERPFRLPRCIMGIEFYVRLTGTSRVREVHLGGSINDLVQIGDTTYTFGNQSLTKR